jgi:hypothetical protein
MRSVAVIFLTLSSAIAALAPPAEAQMRRGCSELSVVREQMRSMFQEEVTALAMQGNGNLLILFQTDMSKVGRDHPNTWTLYSATPQGVACMVAAGSNWETLTIDGPET